LFQQPDAAKIKTLNTSERRLRRTDTAEVPISEFLLTLVTLSIIESGPIIERSEKSRIGEYSTMAATPSRPCANEVKPVTFPRDARSVDIEELLAENDRLRNLVVQLSKLVIKNVADSR
jgi:hypothetical protein